MEIENLFIQKKEYNAMKEDSTILLKRSSFQIFFSFSLRILLHVIHMVRFSYFLSSSQIPVGNTHWIFSSVSPNLSLIFYVFDPCCIFYMYFTEIRFHDNGGKQSEKQDEITAESEIE